ncbi:hypothetical protein [Brevundimonas sp.]|uniref:hypothetical protein n=1 Tax=Brevundimonas sp. TaxID=1871086 RepID=UPI0027F6C3F4|nr:hypothetical protein [Brevundimonas sp.]MDQ7811127.1 hypothetical protein [Brevundimonas sp.]
MTYPGVTPTPGLDLVVVDNGVRLPTYEAPPVEEVVSTPAPVRQPPPPPPPVPVYVPKQDRN